MRVELNIDLKKVQPPTSFLFSIVEALNKMGRDHYATYEEKTRSILNNFEVMEKTRSILNNLEVTDMDWHPYTADMLPAQLHVQIPLTTRLSPLFCYNFVEHHLPHLSARQFEVLEGLNLDGVGDFLEFITLKYNKEKTGQNFVKHYEKELEIWNKRLFVEKFDRTTSGTSATQRTASNSVFSPGEFNPVSSPSMFKQTSPGSMHFEEPPQQHFEEPLQDHVEEHYEEPPQEQVEEPLQEAAQEAPRSPPRRRRRRPGYVLPVTEILGKRHIKTPNNGKDSDSLAVCFHISLLDSECISRSDFLPKNGETIVAM